MTSLENVQVQRHFHSMLYCAAVEGDAHFIFAILNRFECFDNIEMEKLLRLSLENHQEEIISILLDRVKPSHTFALTTNMLLLREAAYFNRQDFIKPQWKKEIYSETTIRGLLSHGLFLTNNDLSYSLSIIRRLFSLKYFVKIIIANRNSRRIFAPLLMPLDSYIFEFGMKHGIWEADSEQYCSIMDSFCRYNHPGKLRKLMAVTPSKTSDQVQAMFNSLSLINEIHYLGAVDNFLQKLPCSTVLDACWKTLHDSSTPDNFLFQMCTISGCNILSSLIRNFPSTLIGSQRMLTRILRRLKCTKNCFRILFQRPEVVVMVSHKKERCFFFLLK